MYNLARKFSFVNNFDDLFETFEDLVNNVGSDPLNLEVNVAGINTKDISVTVDGGHLLVKGETDKRKVNNSYVLPRNINIEHIEVKYDNGLLLITAPTSQKTLSVKIENKE